MQMFHLGREVRIDDGALLHRSKPNLLDAFFGIP